MTLEFIFFFFPFSQFLHILPCFCFVHAINPCGVSRPGAPFSWFYYKWYDETLGSIYDDLVDETLWARILIFRRRPAFISLMAQVALLSPFFYLSTLQTIGIDGLDIHLSQATLPTFCKLFFFSLETDWLLFWSFTTETAMENSTHLFGSVASFLAGAGTFPTALLNGVFEVDQDGYVGNGSNCLYSISHEPY